MMKRMLSRIAAVFMVLIFTLNSAVPEAIAQSVKNPDTFTYATIGDADSMDPAWSYDTNSWHIILNVYEPLFFYYKSSTSRLVPLTASKVPSRENGLISADGKTYTIPIRKGVKFHDGTPMTPEDVRYSLLRFMLFDRTAGPSALLLEPLLGYAATRDEKGTLNLNAYRDAARAVTVVGDTVVLHLAAPFAPILSILAQWAPVVSKKWAIAHGDWDGTEATWAKFNNGPKENSPLFEKANGTGPFMLERWDRKTKEIVLTRNEHYWRAPAKLRRVIVKAIPEFGTRKLLLQAGDADAIYAERSVHTQVKNIPGVSIIDDLPTIQMDPVAFFIFHLNAVGNSFIGSGQLDGAGIPPDFFTDKDVRKAFAFSFDYKGYIRDVLHGKGVQATSCIPQSLPGNNQAQKTYTFDLDQARTHFQKAWEGKVWRNGFRFTLAFNSGNVLRESVCQILKRNIESLNPKFKIDVRAIEWPAFLDGQVQNKLPLFVMGWSADYPDPYDFAFPMLHSQGTFPVTQKYNNPELDRLIEAVKMETNYAKRNRIYAKIQALEYEDVPHFVVVDARLFRTQRDWVKGWYHNPIFPFSPYDSYYYPISKSAP